MLDYGKPLPEPTCRERSLLKRPRLRHGENLSRYVDFARSLLKMSAFLVFGFVIVTSGWVLILRWVPIANTPLVAIRAVEASFARRPIRFEKDWIAIDEMAPSLIRAAIASEDYRFVDHFGFDFDAIQKAMAANERAEKSGRVRLRGASTISQQTAKNVFLWPGRSWLRKGLEAWFTILIEAMWPKTRILEVYLNVIEIGDGVYGVESASHRFFRKPAKKLNPSEAALLIAVLPNPKRFRVERPSPYVRYRQASILRRMWDVDVPK